MLEKEAVYMRKHLQTIFPSLIKAEPHAKLDTGNFRWFKTDDNEIVGIAKHELTEKESQLLEAFLEPYQMFHPPVTKREQQWINVLFQEKDANQLIVSGSPNTVRFVHFSLPDQTIDPVSFREAIHGLFSKHMPILWENSQEGVIIEETLDYLDDFVSYEQIIDVLMSDFYVKLRFYISEYFEIDTLTADSYQWVKDCFRIAQRFNKMSVTTYVEAIPYLLLDQADEKNSKQIIKSTLQATAQDEELLKTVETFLKCNSNATLAAKELHMHRNSLQYRVDKFIEKTNIDVKQFKGALTVYIALQLKQNS